MKNKLSITLAAGLLIAGASAASANTAQSPATPPSTNTTMSGHPFS